MGKGGQGKGTAAPKRWPRVVTAADAIQPLRVPATSLPVDTREEPFLLKHAILEASTWTSALPAGSHGSQSAKQVVQVVLSDEEVAQFISSLTPKHAPEQHGEQAGKIEVEVLRMSGDPAFVGTVDADMTIAEFKQRVQEETGIHMGWQVLLLGDGYELHGEQKLAAYSQGVLEIQLQVFKFRDLCSAAAFGNNKYGATLALLEEAQRGDHALSCVAGYNLAFNSQSTEEMLVSFQLLARTLSLQPACQVLVNALAASSSGLRHEAAVQFARLFHESPESAECLGSACFTALDSARFVGSDLAHKLFEHLKKIKFPPHPVPYTGPQIRLPLRDPIEVAREHLEKHMDFAKSLPANWHYRTLTPLSQGFDIDEHLGKEARNAAVMLKMDVSQVSRSLTWSIAQDLSGGTVLVAVEPSFLFSKVDQQMSDVDVFCGIAEHARIPAESTRMALECAARLSRRSNRRALAAACWCAGHNDAAVREQALEVLQCVAQVHDLPAVQSMLQSWWGADCHSHRIYKEIELFCTC